MQSNDSIEHCLREGITFFNLLQELNATAEEIAAFEGKSSRTHPPLFLFMFGELTLLAGCVGSYGTSAALI